MLVVLSIATIAMLTYTSSGARTVRYDASRNVAATTAEAGLNEAISVLSQATADGIDVRDPSALPAGSDTFGANSASWSGVVDGDTWTISSTSTVANPSGAADVHHTVSSQFRIGVDGQGYAPAWQYVFTDDPTCTTIENSAQISSPFYVTGDLCLKNSANPIADEITVKGHITLQNSSQIGSPTAPIQALHTSGCSRNANGPWTLDQCTPANHVYADTVDSTFANVAKPTVDLAYWYAYSKPGPRSNCTSGSFPGGFDNNSTMDRSLPDVQLLPATGYSCTVTSGSSTLGKIVWTPGTPGTLQISGVIFIDGNIVLDNTDQAIYQGRGTIYTSGTVKLRNSAFLCGSAACDPDSWDGDTNMLMFVAGSCKTYQSGSCTSYDDSSFTTEESSVFQGGVYSVNDTHQRNSSLIEGPVISRQLYLENSTVAHKWPPIDFVSYGAPAPIGAVKLVAVSGTYTG